MTWINCPAITHTSIRTITPKVFPPGRQSLPTIDQGTAHDKTRRHPARIKACKTHSYPLAKRLKILNSMFESTGCLT